MSVKATVSETLCPISRAEAVVGDRWTVLVLRELFMGSHRFDEIQAQTGGTPQMVAARLKSMEADGLLERRAYSEKPKRYEYHLTEKGDAFYSVVLALRAWAKPGANRPRKVWRWSIPTAVAASPPASVRCVPIAGSPCAAPT